MNVPQCVLDQLCNSKPKKTVTRDAFSFSIPPNTTIVAIQAVNVTVDSISLVIHCTNGVRIETEAKKVVVQQPHHDWTFNGSARMRKLLEAEGVYGWQA